MDTYKFTNYNFSEITDAADYNSDEYTQVDNNINVKYKKITETSSEAAIGLLNGSDIQKSLKDALNSYCEDNEINLRFVVLDGQIKGKIQSN